MRPTISQYARSLEELSSGISVHEASQISENFFGFLKRRGEGKKWNAILKQLEKMDAQKEERIAVTVVLAHPADEATKKKLVLQAHKLFPDKKVELEYVVDAEMIGGAVFRTDEVLYDATLSTEVNNLKKFLLKA
jgi:F0F1-type ATP synthase delta subunit